MRNSLVLVALSVSLAACSSTNAVGVPITGDFGSFNGATVELTAEGGIAAFSVHHLVRHDDRAYVYSQRMICGQSCGAPLDSASGTLAAATTDSLFNVVLAQSPFSLADDYGITQGGADMMTYVLKVVAGGNVKTIRADDGTMPDPMRKIVQTLRETIAAARK
jgi:hypothetical protein